MKERVGDFANGRRESQRSGQPELVPVHHFVAPDRGNAIPCGVYDLSADRGLMDVGRNDNTPAVAVASVGGFLTSPVGAVA
jgi:hypothetical protein